MTITDDLGHRRDIGPSDTGTAATVVPDRSALGRPPRRRRLRGVRTENVVSIVGSMAASLCLTVLLFGRIAPFSGLIGFVVVAYGLFLCIYLTVLSQGQDGPAVRDAVATVLLWSAMVLVIAVLAGIIIFTCVRGSTAFFHSNFFTQDLHHAGPLSPLAVGGVEHAIIGTLWMISIALLITIPVGLVGAIYINQSRSRFARLVRTLVEAMTALPSIVAGLFIYAMWILTFHQEKSGFAAALALTIMMLPILIRASDVVLRLVPGTLKEASGALGAPNWRTVWHVILPTARSGLATAVILATARGIGETSPVLLTAGYTTYLNTNPTHGPMVSLPLAAFQLVNSPEPNVVARGFAAAMFLLLLVLALFLLARFLGGRAPGDMSGRERRRAQRRSNRDRTRFEALASDEAQQFLTRSQATKGEFQ